MKLMMIGTTVAVGCKEFGLCGHTIVPCRFMHEGFYQVSTCTMG